MDDPWYPVFSSLEYACLPRNSSGFSYKEETQMFVPFRYHICFSSLYENPDGFLGRHAYSNEEKIGYQGSSTVITLYVETCYVANMVSPGGVVVITPD